MRTIMRVVVLVALCALANLRAGLVYSDGGDVGAGVALVADAQGVRAVAYEAATWSAFYDDGAESGLPLACYAYSLQTAEGLLSVFAVYGAPSPLTELPTAAGWSFWSYQTDLGEAAPPDFLAAFWAAIP